jgi:transketolase
MAALSDAPVIAIFSHTGFQDAADGASHQALSYLAQLGSIPQTEVYALTCSLEAEALVTAAVLNFQALRSRGEVPPSYVFYLGREDFPRQFGSPCYKLGAAQVIADTSDAHPRSVTIAVAGSLMGSALRAAEDLAQHNIGAIVVNPSCLSRPDEETFRKALTKSHGVLITVEDHQICGGLSGYLVPPLIEAGIPVSQLKRVGVRNHFGRSAYTAGELYSHYGLDSRAIVSAALEIKTKN